jgi:hypothetical protein
LSIVFAHERAYYILRLDYFDFLQMRIIGGFGRLQATPACTYRGKKDFPFGPI